MANVGFVGLGVMGFPMAGHLQAHGHTVSVYNRTKERADLWVSSHGGASAATPREAATNAEFVFTCVGNDDDVRSVALGDDGILAGLPKNSIFVDHTTASATLAREMEDAAKIAECSFLDAPVSGGQAGAENGALTVMVGGAEDAFNRALPVMDAYSKAVQHMGEVSTGQLAKMVNQICIAGLVQALSEGIHFAENAGLDVDKVLAAISRGAAQSWQMENRAKTMHADEFEFGFAVDWMRKDLGLCLDEASKNGARLPVSALVNQFYGSIQDRGGGRWDTSSLIRLLRR